MKINLRSGLTLFIALIALTATIAVIISAAYSNEEQLVPQRLSIGTSAPEFEATNTDGEKVSLADYQGKVVLINFWASWCGPCVNEMPLNNDVFQEHADEIVTLFVNVGESKGTVNEFLSAHQFQFPVIIDATGKLSELYSITGLPVTYILNKEGAIGQVITGEISSKQQLYSFIEEVQED